MIRVHEDRSSMLAGQQEAGVEVNHVRAFSQAPKLPAYSLGQGKFNSSSYSLTFPNYFKTKYDHDFNPF